MVEARLAVIAIAAAAGIVGLVPHIPAQDAIVFCEAADDVLHIAFQAGILRGIGQRRLAGPLYPAGIVHPGNRRVLRAELVGRVPAGIEQDQQRLDVMPGGDRQEGINAFLEARRVLDPQRVMQEDPHGGHAHAFRPTQLAVDLGGVEAFGLPHLKLVDGGSIDVVGADQPLLLAIPGIGLVF